MTKLIDKSVMAITHMYVDKMGDALEETLPVLEQAQTPEEHNMLTAMLEQLIKFNDLAVLAIHDAAKRLEDGNI